MSGIPPEVAASDVRMSDISDGRVGHVRIQAALGVVVSGGMDRRRGGDIFSLGFSEASDAAFEEPF